MRVIIDSASKGVTETREVRPSVTVADVIRIAVDRLLVAVVPLQSHLNLYIILTRADKVDRVGVQWSLVAIEMVNKGADPSLKLEVMPKVSLTLVNDRDRYATIKEGELTKTGAQHLKAELIRLLEDALIWMKADLGPGLITVRDSVKGRGGLPHTVALLEVASITLNV